MARAQATDPLHNFRFHATVAVDGADAVAFTDSTGAQAGFMSASTPEVTVEAVEYREGIDTWTKKLPGVPTWSDVTLARGVMKTDTSFFDWISKAIGNEEYRGDLSVYQWHRDGKTPGQIGDLGKARIYSCYEAIPTRVKLAGDLDSTASDISLAEVDIAYEYAEITNAS